MGCRFILFTVSKKGPISNSGLTQRRLFNSFQLISICWFSVDSISKSWFFNLIFLNLKSSKIWWQSTYFRIQVSISRRFNLIYSIRFPKFIKIRFRFFEFLILVLKLIQSTVSCSKFPDSWFPNSVFGRDSNSWFLFQKPPKRKSHLKKPIPFFKMGPVNLKNPNFSFSVRFTVKNTILDRAFTRRFKISIPRFGNQFSISGEIPILSFYFWGGTIHIFNSIEYQFWCGTP
jgi:hypothetical protein